MQKPALISVQDQVPQGARIVEAYTSSVTELFYVRNPKFRKGTPESRDPLNQFLQNSGIHEVWVYYPWCNIAVHTVEESAYFELRTARNKNLITLQEQTQYRNSRIGVAGLSVGSWAITSLVATGGPKYITLADFDVVEVSNLNRIRATLLDIGTHKAELAARCVWETDPFAEISIFDRGVSKETLHSFINEPSPIDVFIDAMDSLALKVEAREACRRARIPVLMATDLADGILLDVERYDENPAYQLFHGTVGQITGDMVHALDYRAWAQLATKIIGSENLPPRMRSSLLEIGKTLPAVPQLATGAAVAGSALAYAVRMIVCGMPLSSGRYRIGFDDLIGTVEDRAARLKEDGMSDEKFKSKFFS